MYDKIFISQLLYFIKEKKNVGDCFLGSWRSFGYYYDSVLSPGRRQKRKVVFGSLYHNRDCNVCIGLAHSNNLGERRALRFVLEVFRGLWLLRNRINVFCLVDNSIPGWRSYRIRGSFFHVKSKFFDGEALDLIFRGFFCYNSVEKHIVLAKSWYVAICESRPGLCYPSYVLTKNSYMSRFYKISPEL